MLSDMFVNLTTTITNMHRCFKKNREQRLCHPKSRKIWDDEPLPRDVILLVETSIIGDSLNDMPLHKYSTPFKAYTVHYLQHFDASLSKATSTS